MSDESMKRRLDKLEGASLRHATLEELVLSSYQPPSEWAKCPPLPAKLQAYFDSLPPLPVKP